MIERFDIAVYCRISVDEELDRDRSGYTFGQREGCTSHHIRVDKLDRNDLELMIEKIRAYEDHLDIQLKADIDSLLKCGTLPEEEAGNFEKGMGNISPVNIVQASKKRPDTVLYADAICEGEPFAVLTSTSLVVDKEISSYSSSTRRPYFQLRGKRISEQLTDILLLKCAFPWLDFVAAITYWNENPHRGEDFLNVIEIGIWSHDGAVEFMGPRRAREKYQEYEALYGEADQDIYMPEYYMDRKIPPVDLSYLKRCIETYGLNPDKVLSHISDYIWKD